jgi:hypothetical protein
MSCSEHRHALVPLKADRDDYFLPVNSHSDPDSRDIERAAQAETEIWPSLFLRSASDADLRS